MHLALPVLLRPRAARLPRTLAAIRRRGPARVPVLLMLLALLGAGTLPALARAADDAPIPAADARRHVGETVTVCGRVVDTAYLESLRGTPTFLNFEQPYPNSVFTVVIWGDARGKFPEPPHLAYEGATLCVTGRVETYRGTPQIIVRDPGQIEVTEAVFREDRFDYEERVFLKAVLAGLGYPVDEGTGEWDAGAERALRAFQEAEGIEPDGRVGAPTFRRLAEVAPRIDADARTRILQLLLLNLALREDR